MRLRRLYLWHRYVGIALCLLFAVWFVSGVVMMYVRMPILFPSERFEFLTPFDPSAITVTPAQAALAAGLVDPPRRMRLASLGRRPVYYFLPRGQRWRGVYADTGEPVGTVQPDQARAMAARAYPKRDPQHISTVDTIDQWTLTNSLNLHRPLHRIAIGDDEGTEVYVSAVTGEIVMRTRARERALAWFGPIIHWGAPEALRTRVGLWRQVMLWISFAGVTLASSGLVLGIVRYRRRGYRIGGARTWSPYRGWKRWHHWGGLAFGTVTLTWMVSGWLYLNPGGSRSGPLETITTMSPYNVGGVRADNAARPEHAAALAGGPLDPSLFTVTVADAWSRIAEPTRPREIELTRVGGDPYFIVYADWDRSWIVPASGPASVRAQARFDAQQLTAIASRMIPDARVTETRLIDAYDAYYYSVGAVAPKRLPVFRIAFDDPERTWYYIDPHTGSIFRRYDRHGRMMRWLVNGFHTLDLPVLFAHRPAWDLAIIGLSAGGFFLSVTGMIIGWGRVARQSRRVRRHAALQILEPVHDHDDGR
jgi:hypothetical protein